MKGFPRNKKYGLVALYVLGVILFGLLLALVAFNLGDIFSWIGSAIGKIRGLIYGILFALILYPFVHFYEDLFRKLLERRGKEHPKLISLLSLITTYLSAVLVLGIILLAILPHMAASITELAGSIRGAVETTRQWLEAMVKDVPYLQEFYVTVTNFLIEYVGKLAEGIVSLVIEKVAGSAIGIVMDTVVGVILSIYLLAGRKIIGRLFGKTVAAFLPMAGGQRFSLFFKRLYGSFTEFIFARIVSALALGTSTYFLFWLIGVPFYPLLSLLIIVLNVVPVLGPILSFLISLTLIFITSRDCLVWAFLIMAALQLLDNLFLEPRLIRHRTLRPDVGTTSVLLLLGYALLGLTGLVIAIPVYATVEATVRSYCVKRLNKKELPTDLDSYRHFRMEEHDPSVVTKEPSEGEGTQASESAEPATLPRTEGEATAEPGEAPVKTEPEAEVDRSEIE